MVKLEELQFNVDPVKLNASCMAVIKKKGYIYPSEEFIMAISEDAKAFTIEVTTLSNEDLLNKMAVTTSLLASAGMDEAQALTEVAGYERDLEFTKAKILQMSVQSKITDKRQEALVNEEVVKLQEKLQVAETKLRLYTALRSSYEKFIFLYSRTLAVRGEESKLQ